ncbi:ABC transporter permease [Streptomyces sp. NPDC093544]|jgi:ABC-2 type transport system permease protein|uniref:ABC transporter permease n=1 Tax=Streptomyces sp. NPDC093544 TaxID=3155200 RepID=UPI00343BC79E
MSTLTAEPTAARTRPEYRVTGVHVLRSEWAKLWSLRSTWITLGLSLVILVGFGLIFASAYSSGGNGRGPGSDVQDGIAVALGGINFAQLALGVLGVLVMAGEYSTGMIRSTLAAVPTRLPVLWSKIVAFGGIAFLITTVAVFVSFFATQGVLSGSDIELGISDSGVVRSLLGAGAYLALAGVLGVALGALLRSVAGGIGLLVVVLMLLPVFSGLLSTSLQDDISPYLPSNAGGSMFALHQASNTLSPGAGLAVLVGWVALAVAGAAWRLKRSDV